MVRKYLQKKARRLKIRKRRPESSRRLRIDGRFASKEQIKLMTKAERTAVS